MNEAELLLETLRFGEVDAGRLADEWARVDTRGLDRLLALEQCEVWLHRRLGSLGLLDTLEPTFAGSLARRARAVAAHGLLVDAQLQATVRALNRLDIPHVLLKGAARRLLATRMPFADARAMGDVDVLVPAELARGAWEAFTEAGFHVAYDPTLTPDGHYHLLPIVDDLSVVVELHASLFGLPPAEAWRRQWDGSLRVETPGGGTRVPCPTELFWHALTHCLQHGVGAFNLRFLLDIASVWASEEDLAWDVVIRRWEGDEIAQRAHARLWLGEAAWLAGRDGSEAFGPLPHGHLQRLLRWRLAWLRREPSRRFAEKLLEEAARVEFGLPVAPLIGGTGPWESSRRRAASLLGRAAYLAWR
ncbi:MAG: nucleotidyltransferase family protein [Gemmatimonadales bacterium]